jgi:hypothetical protein
MELFRQHRTGWETQWKKGLRIPIEARCFIPHNLRKVIYFAHIISGRKINMNRYFLIVGLAILLGILPAMSLAQENIVSGDFPVYDGIWDTDMGPLALWQANDAVWGVYGSKAVMGGHIDSDGILRFYYEDNPDDMGSGWLKVTGDGSTLEGLYTSSVEMRIQGTWNGTMLGPNDFAVGDREALNYQPGDLPPVESADAAVAETSDETTTAEETTTDETIAAEEIPAEFAGDVVSAWTGTWDTTRGELVLTVADIDATGTFGDGCEFTGTISGTTLNGTWTMIDSTGTVTSGEVLFSLSEDGLSFRGTYSTSTAPDLWLAWQGTKI